MKKKPPLRVHQLKEYLKGNTNIGNNNMSNFWAIINNNGTLEAVKYTDVQSGTTPVGVVSMSGAKTSEDAVKQYSTMMQGMQKNQD